MDTRRDVVNRLLANRKLHHEDVARYEVSLWDYYWLNERRVGKVVCIGEDAGLFMGVPLRVGKETRAVPIRWLVVRRTLRRLGAWLKEKTRRRGERRRVLKMHGAAGSNGASVRTLVDGTEALIPCGIEFAEVQEFRDGVWATVGVDLSLDGTEVSEEMLRRRSLRAARGR